jgi:hypothetical protein
MQAQSWAQPTLATSGRNSLESFGKFSRVSSWAKTFAACLVGAEGFSSKLCVLTWKLKATQYSRFYFQLQVLVRPTSETGSGLLLKTPNAFLMEGRTPHGGSQSTGTLAQQAQTGELMRVLSMLPTPRANKIAGYSSPGFRPTLYQALLPTPTVSGNHNRKGASPNSGDGLSTAVKMLATPTARDWKSGKASPATMARNSRPLSEQIGGLLNPRFVAQMMGFPPDWCELPAPALSS